MNTKPIDRQDFGRRLQRLLLDRKPMPWSQADLARAAGMGRDAISTYIRGKSLPEPHSLKKIADALGVDIADLMPDLPASASEAEIPALSIRQLAGQPNKVWLQVNQAVTLDQAAQIMSILNRLPPE